MRASCVTDWAEALPAHVVAKWLGHSPLVAAKHYLQTRDAHFEVAIRGGARVGSEACRDPQHKSSSCEIAKQFVTKGSVANCPSTL